MTTFLKSAPVTYPSWMGVEETPETADWVIIGLPYDGTTSFRPGTRFGPASIREASWGLETYSPLWHRELGEDIRYFDGGDLEFPMGNREETLNRIYNATKEVIASGRKWFGIGGEHLVTLPTIQAMVEKYPNLAILHFDAHADLREDYLGEPLSHATVLRRCVELIDPKHFVQVGIRSGTREEFTWMQETGCWFTDINNAPIAKQKLEGRPVFLTLDLDVLDPSILPGTGTPEPGGLTFRELQAWLKAFEGLHFVGADVVELSPHYDASGVSTVVGAKTVRDVLMLLSTSL